MLKSYSFNINVVLALKHIPEGELFVEQVVHIPALETLLVNSTLYRRNAGVFPSSLRILL